MNKHLKKISEEILAENPWWKYKHDTYEKPNGEPGDYYYGESTNCSMIVPVLDDGRIILVRQYRYLREKESIEFPCGGLKNEETPQEGAERELLEESGYKGNEFVKIGMFEGLNGLVKDTCHVFIAEALDKIAEPQDDPLEKVEILIRRSDEIDEMVRKNEIWDGQTLAAWAMVHHEFLHKN